MAEKTISTRQKQKYDTSTNWATNNIVLLAGEIGIESDTNKFKVGNGTSTWNELDYTGGSKIPLYSTTGQNTDGAMTQKATTDALPQAVTVTLTESQNFNDIIITNEQFDLLLSNPENYLIIETSNGSLTISLKYRRSQYFTMTSGNILQEALIFNCVNSTSFALYTQRIDSLIIIRQTQNGETNIAVQDDTLDFTTFVPKTRTINGKSLSNDIILTATDVNALPDTTFVSTININGQPQSVVNFDSDPQTQIDNKFDKTGGTITGDTNIVNGQGLVLTPASAGSTYYAFKFYAQGDDVFVEKQKVEGGADYQKLLPLDDALSTTSPNAVQNKVITEVLNNKTTVNISNVAQDSINFTSDPQTQINSINYWIKIDNPGISVVGNNLVSIDRVYIHINSDNSLDFNLEISASGKGDPDVNITFALPQSITYNATQYNLADKVYQVTENSLSNDYKESIFNYNNIKLYHLYSKGPKTGTRATTLGSKYYFPKNITIRSLTSYIHVG